MKKYDEAFIKYINGEYDALSDKEQALYLNKTARNIGGKKSTLRDICEGLGIKVPKKYEDIAELPQKFAFRDKYVNKGDICLIIRSAEEFESKFMTTRDQYNDAINNGAKLIIMGADDFNNTGLDEDAFPVILLDHHNERVLRLFSILRKQQEAKVVMLTGSVGKTTTKNMCDMIAKNHFKTFSSPGNANTVQKTAHHAFYNSNNKNDIYIQECGAGYKGSVRLAASILQPDIFILTNVYEHHLQAYETYENLFADKVSADDYLKEDGVIITNFDDENIRKHHFKHQTVSFSIDYEDADYRAINIAQHRDELTFDIIESKTGHFVNIKVKLLGKHNVYNILAAYIMGRTLGLTDDEIKEDLLEYRTVGIRQNLINVGGVYINVDCYNVAEESILAMIHSGEDFELDEGCKRIALIGGENKLGSDVAKRSLEFGRKLAGVNVDKICFCGIKNRSETAVNMFGDAISVKAGFDQCSKISSDKSTRVKHMIKFLKKNVNRGDLVMFKGIYHLNMPVAIDKFFGTSLSFNLSHYKKNIQKIKKPNYTVNLIPEFRAIEIVDLPIKDGKIKVPNRLEGLFVFRIKDSAFKDNEALQSIDFGRCMKNIGSKAFYGCINLKRLQIPSNIKVIEKMAFGNCSSLSHVYISNGTTHIESKAFINCNNLKEVHLPESIGMIEENVFKGCDSIVIFCKENTFAHKYAVDNDIEFKLK